MLLHKIVHSPASSLFVTGYMNSLLNPIIYAKFNRDFRLPFYYIIKCQCKDINQRVRRSSYITQFEVSRYSQPASSDKQRTLAARTNRRPQQRFSGLTEAPINRGSNLRMQSSLQIWLSVFLWLMIDIIFQYAAVFILPYTNCVSGEFCYGLEIW